MSFFTVLATSFVLLAQTTSPSAVEDAVAAQEQMEIEGGYLHVLVVDGEEIKIQLHDPMEASLPRILGRSISGLDEKTTAVLAAAIEKYLNDTDFAAKIDAKVAHLPASEIKNQLEYLLGQLRKGEAPVIKSVPHPLKYGHPDEKSGANCDRNASTKSAQQSRSTDADTSGEACGFDHDKSR